jgi:hypothetical protein
VRATNLYGDSDYSPEGNGAVIVRIPDAPVNLIEDYNERTPTSLGIQWTDGSESGGLPTLDYRINIAEQG